MENIGLPFAEDGAEYISDTDAHAGNFFALQATSDIVIAAIASDKLSGDTLVGATIPQGVTVYFNFSSVTFTSGTGFAYKAGTK